MARNFVRASSQYLEIAGRTPVIAAPLTMACWIYTDDVTVNQIVMSTSRAADNQRFNLQVAGSVGGDPIRWIVADTGTEIAATSTGVTVNTWHHACGVEVSSTDHSAFIDGGSKVTATDDRTPNGQADFSIGRFGGLTAGGNMSGRIAEPTVWNIALSDLEVALLAAGVHPFKIRPQNIVAYFPLVHDDLDRSETNLATRFHLTPFNSPTFQIHPPKIWRVPPLAAQFIETGELYEMSEPLSYTDFTMPVRRRWMFVPAAAPFSLVKRPRLADDVLIRM